MGTFLKIQNYYNGYSILRNYYNVCLAKTHSPNGNDSQFQNIHASPLLGMVPAWWKVGMILAYGMIFAYTLPSNIGMIYACGMVFDETDSCLKIHIR